MVVSDPISDMLTRIRNAIIARMDKVDIPSSKIKQDIAKILYDEGYIKSYEVKNENAFDIIRVYLKYTKSRESAIAGLKKVSKPGLKVYSKKDKIPKVLGGLGTVIVSTSQGLKTGSDAKKEGLGGEIICFIW
jgi:small subunit ribosomal protein S8